MRNHTCHNCHRPIPIGAAVLRSVSLERVAFHVECAARMGLSMPSRGYEPLRPTVGASRVERAAVAR